MVALRLRGLQLVVVACKPFVVVLPVGGLLKGEGWLDLFAGMTQMMMMLLGWPGYN